VVFHSILSFGVATNESYWGWFDKFFFERAEHSQNPQFKNFFFIEFFFCWDFYIKDKIMNIFLLT
jgi:hypothetical protein